MKNKTYRFAAVAAVLLTLCLVFMMPVSADDTEYTVSTGELATTLTTLASMTNAGTYTVNLQDGTYSEIYDVIVRGSGVIIKIQPGENQKNVVITGTIQPKHTSDMFVGSGIILKNLNFSLTDSKASIYLPVGSGKVNLTLENCNFKGTYSSSTYKGDGSDFQWGINSGGSHTNAGNLKVINSMFDSLSHPLNGHYSQADDVIMISGCTFTNVYEGINIQNTGNAQTVNINNNNINADVYCIRVGQYGNPTVSVTIDENSCNVGDSSTFAAVIIRGEATQSLSVSKNTVSGVKLLDLSAANSLTADKLEFSTNTWNNVESDYPSSDDCNLGAAIDFFGSGTSDDPYLISSKADLVKFADKVNGGEGYSGKFFKLTADVDLGNEEWTPIGNVKANPFSGSFDGNSKTISNLKIYALEQVGAGLFGWVSGSKSIENLNLLNVDVTAKSSVGSFVGTTINSYTFKNIHADNVTITGNYKVGGLIGEGYFKAVDCSVGYADSTHTNYVTGNYKESNLEGDAVGGFVGFLGEGTYDALTNCAVYNTEVIGTRKVGGLVGSAFHNNKLSSVSVADVTVSTNADENYATNNAKTMGVGGLVGLFTLHNDDAGNPVGTATITDASITNVKLVDINNVGASMGYVTGGQRGSDAVATPSEELFTDVEVSVSGTNSGATSSYFVPPAPVIDNTPSSSGGHSEPGAYYNYPRTVTDGGLVEFGTSKVVKSVTLPAGSNGAVVLHIDSTDYWPLAADSEFTFDISVENLGEGTSYISFKIDESKLSALEITAADIGVYHYVNGEWVKLTVTYKIEEGDVIYTAETDSFSPFKLVIEAGAATPAETQDEPVTPPTEEPSDEPQDVPGADLPEIPGVDDEPEEPSSPAPVLGLLAALGAAVVLRRK